VGSLAEWKISITAVSVTFRLSFVLSGQHT
jgi:hypothetical protein